MQKTMLLTLSIIFFINSLLLLLPAVEAHHFFNPVFFRPVVFRQPTIVSQPVFVSSPVVFTTPTFVTIPTQVVLVPTRTFLVTTSGFTVSFATHPSFFHPGFFILR